MSISASLSRVRPIDLIGMPLNPELMGLSGDKFLGILTERVKRVAVPVKLVGIEMRGHVAKAVAVEFKPTGPLREVGARPLGIEGGNVAGRYLDNAGIFGM